MTTPAPGTRQRRQHRGAIPLTVSAASAVAGTPLINGPCTLVGWSLQGGASTLSASASVTSPGAAAVLAQTAGLPVGRYRVTVELSLAGTLGQGADARNVALQVSGGGAVIDLDNTITAGLQIFGPFDLEITAATGNAIQVVTIGAGSVGSIYTVTLTDAQDAQGTITDGGQIVGVFAPASGASDTVWLGGEGVYCGTDVQVRIAQGDASGVVWVVKYDDNE